MNFFQKVANTFKEQGKLAQLIIINVALFLTVNISYHLAHINLMPYVGVEVGGTNFLFKIWTIFTYMFVHESLWELFFNMFLLFFTGQLFFLILGEKKLIYVYVMSGLCGAALLLILGLILPDSFRGTSLSGASAAVLGIVMVMAVYAPGYKVRMFFGAIEVQYKYFALIIFVLSTVIDFSFNMGGKISHIGGAGFGLIYGYSLKKGVDLFNFAFFTRKKTKLKVVSYNKTIDDVYNENRASGESRMNELLDKISKSGYDSLTKKEKDELFNLSQKK